MRKPGTTLLSLVLVMLTARPEAVAQLAPLKGYDTKLFLNEPITPGAARTITGGGAPVGSGQGIWVELWMIPSAGGVPRSVASVAATGGTFVFEGVPVSGGDIFFVTLSRSWHFETEGDFEGWNHTVHDVILSVAGGVLRAELRNLDGDAFTDPYFQIVFPYDPSYYRVVEIRLRNPAPPTPSNLLGIFWGAPWSTRISEHDAQIPSEMDDFQTIQIPMNVEEVCIVPCPTPQIQDGLWAAGALNDSLRLDPLNNIQAGDDSLDGIVFEIDSIRIREDYRREFHHSGDPEGLLARHDLTDFGSEGGFLTYIVSDVGSSDDPVPSPDRVVDPSFFGSLDTGRLDTNYFVRFALGIEGGDIRADSVLAGIFFDDADSTDYWDDCPPLPPPECVPGTTTRQEVNFTLGAAERQDIVLVMDALERSPNEGRGEWTEDGGKVLSSTLRLDCPQNASEGDSPRIDYFGWIPDEPFGPSARVVAERNDVPFRRGDADNSGNINLSDSIYIIKWLVGGGGKPVCTDSADTNDDGDTNLTDGVYLLNFSFTGGPPPPPPGPTGEPCGLDPTEDDLGCAEATDC